MTDDKLAAIRERVNTAYDKETAGNGYCRYCGAEDYPIDENGDEIYGEDLSEAVEFHIPHADTCPSVLLSELLNALERERSENARLREAVRTALNFAAAHLDNDSEAAEAYDKLESEIQRLPDRTE